METDIHDTRVNVRCGFCGRDTKETIKDMMEGKVPVCKKCKEEENGSTQSRNDNQDSK